MSRVTLGCRPGPDLWVLGPRDEPTTGKQSSHALTSQSLLVDYR